MNTTKPRPLALQSEALANALFGRPQLLLRLCAFTILLATLGSVALMLHIPLVSVDAEMGENGTVDIIGSDKRIAISEDSLVTFRSPTNGTTVELKAALLPGVAEPRGHNAENRLYWEGRDRLAAMAARGPVNVAAGGSHVLASSRQRSFSDLTTGFWLSLIAGAAAALAGLWVWVLRPRAWAPVMFALSGTGLFVGCATTALNISPGLGLSGSIDHAMLIANYISGLICAGTLVALFARFPSPVVRPAWLWLLAAVSVGVGIDVTFDLLPNAVDLAILVCVVDSIAIVVLLLVQAWIARKDSSARAALLPIAIGTVISVTLFGVLSLAGQLNGGKPLVSPDMTAPLLLMLYLGLGIAIVRARLFSLGRWALSMLLSACAILLLLVVDAILLATVTQQRDLALFISAIVGITVYLPMREWILRRAERLRDGQTRDLLQFAGDMALAPTASDTEKAWLSAVAAMFEPLEVEPTDFGGLEPAIKESGSALYFPSPLAGSALLLRYPGGGTRMFGAPDLETVLQFNAIVQRLLEARNSYMRGVDEERGRIARDLHDDVSARLLTSLHRSDREAMHEDVRSALGEIRTIVTGLSGAPQLLQAMLANLRHETQGRLEASGIELDWPLSRHADEAGSLDYLSSRHLVSIVRECVSNIIRHAGASSASVRIKLIGNSIVVEVKDDGRGIGAHSTMGNGLANAARRATSVGGTFEILPGGDGTQARLIVPLHAGSAPA